MFRHARLVHIVFRMWATTASPSAVNLTAASCSKKTPIAWSTSPMRSGYSRPLIACPSRPAEPASGAGSRREPECRG